MYALAAVQSVKLFRNALAVGCVERRTVYSRVARRHEVAQRRYAFWPTGRRMSKFLYKCVSTGICTQGSRVTAYRRPHLLVMPDTFLVAHRAEITSLMARYRLPAVYPYRFFAEAVTSRSW